MCVCGCLRERERARARAYVCGERERESARARACVRMRVWCVSLSVCIGKYSFTQRKTGGVARALYIYIWGSARDFYIYMEGLREKDRRRGSERLLYIYGGAARALYICMYACMYIHAYIR